MIAGVAAASPTAATPRRMAMGGDDTLAPRHCLIAPNAPTMLGRSKILAVSACPGPWKPPSMRSPALPSEKVPSGADRNIGEYHGGRRVRVAEVDVPDTAEGDVEPRRRPCRS